MNTQHICPSCRKPVTPDAPGGLCPECLLQAGLGTGVDPGSGSGAPKPPGFVAPALAELAPKFPQLELLAFIGQGGMGAVYKARQKGLDRIVALKILPPGVGADAAFAQRFEREAKALARLNHPGVVTLYEFGLADDLYYFLMEFVDGVTLRRLLEAGRMPPREALAIVPQICDALQYAHDEGIVHRDIKPENILIDRRGRVKVADFGLAKLVGGGEGSEWQGGFAAPEGLTQAGKVMGTPQYMAPEQQAHPGEVDHRVDIYALGVVLYQMLTGELPGKPIAPPSTRVSLDVRLDEVVLRALETNPENRYSQASVLKTRVEWIASTGSPPPAPAPESAAGGQFREYKTTACIAWAVVLGLLGLLNGRPALQLTSDTAYWVSLGITGLMLGIYGTLLVSFSRARSGLLIRGVAGASTSLVAFFAAQPFSRTSELPRLPEGVAFGAAAAALGIAWWTWQRRESIPGTARFSPQAIAGALWAGLFFVAACFYIMLHTVASSGVLENLAMSAILVAGVSAPIGTTLLGWLGVNQIRRSNGKVYGLGLAAFDALLFPLLALDAVLGALFAWVNPHFLGYYTVPGGPFHPPGSRDRLFAWDLVVAIVLLLILNLLIIRWAWRKLSSTGPRATKPATSHPGVFWIFLASMGGAFFGSLATEAAPTWIRTLLAAVAVGLLISAVICFAQRGTSPAKAREATSSLRVVIILFIVFGVLFAGASFLADYSKIDPKDLAQSPQKLRSAPTDLVIRAALADLKGAWAWGQLEERVRRSALKPAEVITLFNGLGDCFRTNYPEGYNEPLNWISGFAREMSSHHLLPVPQAVEFMKAYLGTGKGEEVRRVFQGETQVDVECRWRNIWERDLLGLTVMNEMKSISIDRQPVLLSATRPWSDWNSEEYRATLPLPAFLKTGPHVLRCVIKTALVDEENLAGFDPAATSDSWPPARATWLRTNEIPFTVYPAGTEPVELVYDQSLSPAANIQVRQIFIRKKEGKSAATVLFNVDSRVIPVPVSFQATLRVGNKAYPLGLLWSETPNPQRYSRGDGEFTIQIEPLPAPGPGEIQTADLELVPDKHAIRWNPRISRIWGEEIRIQNVPLTRQDLGLAPATEGSQVPMTKPQQPVPAAATLQPSGSTSWHLSWFAVFVVLFGVPLLGLVLVGATVLGLRLMRKTSTTRPAIPRAPPRPGLRGFLICGVLSSGLLLLIFGTLAFLVLHSWMALISEHAPLPAAARYVHALWQLIYQNGFSVVILTLTANLALVYLLHRKLSPRRAYICSGILPQTLSVSLAPGESATFLQYEGLEGETLRYVISVPPETSLRKPPSLLQFLWRNIR